MNIFLRLLALAAAVTGFLMPSPPALATAVLAMWASLLPRENEVPARPGVFLVVIVLTLIEAAMSRSAAGVLFASVTALAWRLHAGAEEEIDAELRRATEPLLGRLTEDERSLTSKRADLQSAEESFQRLTRRFEIVRSFGAALWFEEVWREIESGAKALLGARPILWLPPLPGDLPEGFHPATTAALEDTGAWRRARGGERVEMKIGGSDGIALWIPLSLGNGATAVLHLLVHRDAADEEALEIFVSQVGLLIEKLRLYYEVELQSRTDLLTGLPHHANFRATLEAEEARAKRSGRPLSLLMTDVDFFKAVNDTHGHLAGDQVLVRIASTIRLTTRLTDFVARYGGEEFAVLLPETALPGATEIAERIRQAVAAEPIAVQTPGGVVQIAKTISLGVAEYYANAEDSMTLLKRADAALYRAKEGGRNRVVTES